MEGLPILSLMMCVPLVGAALCLFSGANAARLIALGATMKVMNPISPRIPASCSTRW